jgi:hypothetical protein
MTIHAFPSGHNPKTGMIEQGMTLRDYFAAKAMQQLMSTEEYEFCCETAYKWADAMMKARDE